MTPHITANPSPNSTHSGSCFPRESDGASCRGLCALSPKGYQTTLFGANLEKCPVNFFQNGLSLKCKQCPPITTYTDRGGLTNVNECECTAGHAWQMVLVSRDAHSVLHEVTSRQPASARVWHAHPTPLRCQPVLHWWPVGATPISLARSAVVVPHAQQRAVCNSQPGTNRVSLQRRIHGQQRFAVRLLRRWHLQRRRWQLIMHRVSSWHILVDSRWHVHPGVCVLSRRNILQAIGGGQQFHMPALSTWYIDSRSTTSN